MHLIFRDRDLPGDPQNDFPLLGAWPYALPYAGLDPTVAAMAAASAGAQTNQQWSVQGEWLSWDREGSYAELILLLKEIPG